MKLKTIDLCAGIGGIRRGFELAGGYRNIASAEIDEMACKTYEHLFHEDPRNDVTNEKFKKHLQTLHYDVLMAGFPCQAFSSVGLQHGFEDKTKGTIFFDIAKIIKMTRPKVVFLENVQNLLSHDKQATFKTIVDTLDRQLDYHIVGVTHDKDGIPQYKRSAFLRNSRDFGVPQNRPRVYIVAFSRAYFGQHISLLPEEAPTKRSRTPVFKSLADVLDKKVDSRFFLSSGYLDTLEKHIVTQHKKGYGFGYCIVNAPEIETPIANTLLATGGSGRERNLIYDPINGASCAGTSIKGKSSEYNSEQKDDFIVQSYSLMNLFMTAVFSIGLLEELIEYGIVDSVEKPDQRLHRIEETAKGFPDFLKESATSVVSILEDAYLELHDSTYKETAFLKAIETHQGKIAVIVPKAYFGIVINKLLSLHNLDSRANICIMTANRFDNTQLYSAIIVVGNISGKRFDALRCRSSQEIDLLLYECEKYRYKKQVRDAKAAEHLLNTRSTILTDDEYEEDSIGIDEYDLNEVDNINTEIMDYISSSPIKAIRNSFSGGDGKSMAEIVAVAKFDSDEIAFFTKNYKAYVLDEADNSVKEVVASDLSEGDVIVFTRSTSKTRDIVEEILRDMINNKLVPPEIEKAYYKSREWKKTLIDYMKQTGSSAKAIADEMISNGVSVQEITIRGWLDEESHTVRPQKLDSIQQIALIAGNDELFDSAEVCFDAGGQIYKIRRRILKAIGQAILGEVTGNSNATDSMTATVADRIKDAAVTLQIETITFVDDEVPVNTINRPITIDQ